MVLLQRKLGSGKFFSIVLVASFILALATSFWRYYYTRNYDFIVESSCDPAKENCFQRDCTNPDDCPPNGLSDYKVFKIKAYNFSKCADNSCKTECETGKIKCEVVPCGAADGDVCKSGAVSN